MSLPVASQKPGNGTSPAFLYRWAALSPDSELRVALKAHSAPNHECLYCTRFLASC